MDIARVDSATRVKESEKVASSLNEWIGLDETTFKTANEYSRPWTWRLEQLCREKTGQYRFAIKSKEQIIC